MENKIEKNKEQPTFESYQEYFDLSEEQLKAPLLDVGSNYGDFINYVRGNYDNENAYGIEYQKEKADIAGPAIINANGLDIPFDDEVFDTVIAKNYLPMFLGNQIDVEQSVNELIRVTKKGGIIKGDFSTPESEDMIHAEMVANDIDDPWYEPRRLSSVAFLDYINYLNSIGLKAEVENRILPSGKTTSILTIHK